MNPWRPLLRSIEDELERLSQEVRGQRVLPNSIEVVLPEAELGHFASVLEPVTAELGEKLLEWATQRGRSWYAGNGPRLVVHLGQATEPGIECAFTKKLPDGERPDTRKEPAKADS
jgi:hypothetical protein